MDTNEIFALIRNKITAEKRKKRLPDPNAPSPFPEEIPKASNDLTPQQQAVMGLLAEDVDIIPAGMVVVGNGRVYPAHRAFPPTPPRPTIIRKKTINLEEAKILCTLSKPSNMGARAIALTSTLIWSRAASLREVLDMRERDLHDMMIPWWGWKPILAWLDVRRKKQLWHHPLWCGYNRTFVGKGIKTVAHVETIVSEAQRRWVAIPGGVVRAKTLLASRVRSVKDKPISIRELLQIPRINSRRGKKISVLPLGV